MNDCSRFTRTPWTCGLSVSAARICRWALVLILLSFCHGPGLGEHWSDSWFGELSPWSSWPSILVDVNPFPQLSEHDWQPDPLLYSTKKGRVTLTFLIVINADFSKGYSRLLWLTRTLPMPPMSTSTAQVISYSESSESKYPKFAESDKNLVFQRPSMLAGKFDEARKHAHSSLQILSRHLPKVVKQFKTFKELPTSLKQSSMLVKFHTQTLNLNFWTVHCPEPSVIGLQ